MAYSLVRLGAFALTFALLLVLGLQWWLAATLAAVIGLCIGYIFFGRLRDAVARDIVARRAAAPRDRDAEAEDPIA